jgi:hypothetical protein
MAGKRRLASGSIRAGGGQKPSAAEPISGSITTIPASCTCQSWLRPFDG